MPSKGYKLSYEHKMKISKAHLGKKRAPFSEETKLKMSKSSQGNTCSPQGEQNLHWKGDNAGKTAMHDWVKKWKGKPDLCEMCGTITAKRYEWANVDHSYRRILEDYIRMCTSCHRKYDKQRGVKINQWK